MKYWAYALMGLLIAAGAFAANAAYGQQNWYPGEGLEKGLVVKYRISTFDYIQSGGRPFLATIWFGSNDDKGNWLVYAIIDEAGKITTSDLTLSVLNLAPVGFDVTEEFKPYRNAIRGSLGWIGDYASKSHPRPISGDTAWGIVAAIGGGSIVVKPSGTEKLELAGKSWDASIIGFRYGENSKIWVSDNFPLPLKAKVYTISTQKPLPVQYEYELVEIGKSDTRPIPSVSKVELPKSPLTTPTTSGAFNIDLFWEPEIIEPGKPVTLGIVIRDQQQNLLNGAIYDILVTDASGKILLDKKKQLSTREGQGIHEVTFESEGGAHVTVTTIGEVRGEQVTKINEKAEFGLVVVPEFPLGVAAVMAAIVAMVIAVTRFKKLSIPRL